MLDAFVSYLRVYEPLRAFADPAGEAVRAALARGPLRPEQVAERESAQCLRATLRSRLLPTDPVEVLTVTSGGEQLVCPLDTRPRAAAGLLAFLAEEPPLLRAAAVPGPEPAARRAAESALAEIGDGAAHVVTATWTVPLPWFALVDVPTRHLRLEPPRRVFWHVPIGTALARAERAEKIVRDGLGDEGPAAVLAETAAWLNRFDRGSLVELDYGGLVALLDDDDLRDDTSAELVQDALQALHDGDGEIAQVCYEQLSEFWGAVAGRRRDG